MAKAQPAPHVALLKALQEAGIVDDPTVVQRVVIDIRRGDFPRVYIERLGDERLVTVIEALSSVEVERG